ETVAKPSGMTFTSSSSANTDLVTASSTSSAAVGTYHVTVEQLATATRTTSGFATQLGISANVDLNQNLNLPAARLGTAITDGYITINGTQVAVNIDTDDPSNVATNDTVQEVIDRINSTVAGVTASYDSATDSLKLSSAAAITVGSPDDTSNLLQVAGLLNSPDTLNGPDHERVGTHRLGRTNTTAELNTNTFGTALAASGAFTVNGVSITWNAATDSLNEVISRINTQVSTVVASYDAQTDKIVLASRTTGSLGITLGDTSGNFLAATGLLANSGESQAAVTAGENARITIEGFNNGDPIYSTSNTVADVIPGLTLNLQNADPATSVAVSVTRNATDLKTKIQAFVTAYNSAAQLISTRLTEEPLKTTNGSSTLAKVGLLRGDSLLSQMRSQLSSALTEVVSGLPTDYNRLGNLGVTLDKNNVSGGTLRRRQGGYRRERCDAPAPRPPLEADRRNHPELQRPRDAPRLAQPPHRHPGAAVERLR
ncbi:MAG: flagellar filament capping protein FliD, partial [Armatimonadetes bacterium]|nr:flagellar filament capping protein FliD [Armatimonadota bacterium]